ncbi:MAG: N-6 DNA methylase, partial [Truepera sp.]|nr:N-6 DNA methylase [Truepera sp.]
MNKASPDNKPCAQVAGSPDNKPCAQVAGSPDNYVKSKQRVADHGEVFTPAWLVEAMLDLVKDETERIDSRFLEPACGSGNFLVQILRRKLAAVELKFGKKASPDNKPCAQVAGSPDNKPCAQVAGSPDNSDFERRQYALLAVMCIYGIELLEDNIAECRANMLEILADYLKLGESDELYLAASYVLSQNLVHGDALTMRTHHGQAITFAEWGYLGKGKFQRRDFRLHDLALSSTFSAEGSLFAHLGKHEVFTPTKTYPPMTVRELATGF